MVLKKYERNDIMSIPNQVVVCDGGCGSVNKTPALVPQQPQVDDLQCPTEAPFTEESIFPAESAGNKEHDNIKPHVMDSVLGSEFYEALEVAKKQLSDELPDKASTDSDEVGKKGELPQ